MTKPTYEELELRVNDLERTIFENKGSNGVLQGNLHLLQALREGPLSISIVCLDNAYRYLFFNDVHKTAVWDAWATEIVLGSNLLEYIVDENDQAAMQHNFDRALGGETFTLIEEFGSIKRRTWESTYSPVVLPDGQITGLIVFSTDVTERETALEGLKQSEERFRTLFENAPLAYQSLNEQGDFIIVNNTWLLTMGYSREEVIGRNISEFLQPSWKNHFKDNFSNFKAVGEVLGNEFVMLKKEGTEIFVSFQGEIGKNAMGEFKQTYCVFYDITAEKKAAEYQKRHAEQILHSQKMESIGNHAGGIAHEFNNKLAIIMGNNELLMLELPQQSADRNKTEEIQVAGLRARDVVKQLLTFSRQDEAVNRY